MPGKPCEGMTPRKSGQTQATYLSAYRRVAAWMAEQTGDPDPPPSLLSADVVAAYIIELERNHRAPATVRDAPRSTGWRATCTLSG